LGTLEARIENRLQETLDFKRSLFENFSRFQQDESSTPASKQLNLSGDTRKWYQEHDTSCPCMKVEFPRWEDGDPTSWISEAEIFFSLSQNSRRLQSGNNFNPIRW
ncbi:hypothetical protein GW17_00015174, partial [Ensete ventricosum]